jgi:DNA-binding response OmpR family regulator
MNALPGRILLVANNPDINDLVGRQVLQPLGYHVQIAPDVNSAILETARFAPDLVIADLDLPGLNAKDLLVAFNSQGLNVPVIVIAKKGEEQKVIQAFRLGASDYLTWPAREAEVVSAAERVLKQGQEQRARQQLDNQLKQTNQELQRRVRELTTIFAVGKAVISITDQQSLFDKIVEGMVYVAEADYGWLLVRNDQSQNFDLLSHRNLPEAWAKKMGQPLDDGLSPLVALSGETLSIHGEPLKRFKVSSLGRSAMVVPLKIRKEVVGLLMVLRKSEKPFDKNVQSLLEAIADYAAISMVNARLFRALQEAVETAQSGEQYKREQLHELRRDIYSLLQPVTYPLDLFLAGKIGKLSSDQVKALKTIREAVQKSITLVTNDRPTKPGVKIGKNQ